MSEFEKSSGSVSSSEASLPSGPWYGLSYDIQILAMEPSEVAGFAPMRIQTDQSVMLGPTGTASDDGVNFERTTPEADTVFSIALAYEMHEERTFTLYYDGAAGLTDGYGTLTSYFSNFGTSLVRAIFTGPSGTVTHDVPAGGYVELVSKFIDVVNAQFLAPVSWTLKVEFP